MPRLCSLIAVLIIGATCASTSFAQGNRRDDDRFRGDNDFRSRDDDFRSRHDRDRWSRDDRDGRPPAVVFGARSRTDRLAAEFYRQANSICWEMHRYYQRNRDYDVTYREMYKIREAAKRIEDMTQDEYHRRKHTDDRLARDLKELDNLFQHIEADVRSWRPSRRDDSRGNDLDVKMESLEDTLHDLMDDYGYKSTFRRRFGKNVTPIPPRHLTTPIR